jgi:hypothetical protein
MICQYFDLILGDRPALLIAASGGLLAFRSA